MMRIAIAGTGGLALLIARALQEETSHQFVLISRRQQPNLEAYGYQVQVVDYNDASSVQHALLGVDTVISTVTGNNQLRLIESAVRNKVRRFIPAEFEGNPRLRDATSLLDRGRAQALEYLQYYRSYIQSTVIMCGIFYERFAPGGLAGQRIGMTSGFANEGDYILDVRNSTAQAPAYNSSGSFSTVCLTSAKDVAKFVVKALDLDTWPAEMTMCGDRMTVAALVQLAQDLRGRQFHITWHNAETMNWALAQAQVSGDVPAQARSLALLSTAEGHYDFSQFSLNRRFPDVRPTTFRDWFSHRWAGHANADKRGFVPSQY